MIERFTAARARAALAGAALALAIGAPAQPAADAKTAPRPPHQLTPDAPVLPDYFALSLAHVSVTDDPAWRALHLRIADRQADPAFIVLPVQTQAYGFSPMFRALLGARLDRELQRRHLGASRQTDIADWRGPFVRRSDDATLAAFAAEHPSATLLALYLGHDADGHAFLSLARGVGGDRRVAHRRVDIPQELVPTLDAFTAVLPPLLAELGLGDAHPAPPPAAKGDSACRKSDWELEDSPANADPGASACHALLVGTLMPEYLSRLADFTQPSSPERLAWLARAWVEAGAFDARSPRMQSVARLAALQLRIDPKQETTAALADDGDVVVRPLARLLWARARARSMPRQSSDAAARAYVEEATAGLPPFASAVIEQRARFTENFHEVDPCAMEAALPQLKLPAACETALVPLQLRRSRPASLAQTRLMESWRLAAAWSELDVEGRVRGSARGIADTLQQMPPQLASHPFVRELHAAVQQYEKSARSADAHLAQSRARLRNQAVAVATLQREDALLRQLDAEALGVTSQERQDPAIARLLDDLERMTWVVGFDFHTAVLWRPQRNPTLPATFLAAGDFGDAERVAMAPLLRASMGLGAASGPLRVGVPQQRPSAPPSMPGRAIGGGSFDKARVWGMPDKASFETRLAKDRADMGARVGLALLALEGGASVAEARRIVDAQPRRRQAENRLVESQAWSLAAHAFYFAGELPTARLYYARSLETDMGSAGDMLARERIAAIDGKLRDELDATRERAERYDGDSDVGNEASLLFMLGRPQEAWPLLLPRMQTSTDATLWRSAFVGHRIAGRDASALPDWIGANKLEEAAIGSSPGAPQFLFEYATIDRLPAAVVARPHSSSLADFLSISWFGGPMMLRAAIDGTGAVDTAALDRDMQSALYSFPRLLPFYAWATWQATQGKDPVLDVPRGVAPEAGFAGQLAKAMVLSADGRRDDALRALTAARWELGRIGGMNAFPDDFRNSPHDFVLATWLMSRKTGERAYAERGLAVARAYQAVWPYLGWPYAAEALLGRDDQARAIAACRAQKLDPGSMFLRESGLHPDPKGAVCRKATDW